jgi:hypothetical protein
MAMLLTPIELTLAGIVPVIVLCGGAYIVVGVAGLARYAA